MLVATNTTTTAESYLAFERNSIDKHEFLYQTIIPMAGASQKHNVIAMNLAALLWFHLRQTPNVVYQSDMRTHNPVNDSYMYPDVVVSDGKPQLKADSSFDNLINPLVIIEILSPTTAVYDKTDKFIACRSIPSLQEYVLVSVNSPDIEIYKRAENDQWLLIKPNQADGSLTLSSIGFSCSFSDIYQTKE
jgi:Uma2 family endonuclease